MDCYCSFFRHALKVFVINQRNKLNKNRNDVVAIKIDECNSIRIRHTYHMLCILKLLK